MFAMVSSVAEAQSFCVLYAFSGSPDGADPYGGLVMGSSGSLYGTTLSGGQGAGVVFGVKKNICHQEKDTVVHEFGSVNDDGLSPYDTLLIDSTGKDFLYGTTFYGGPSNNGTVFKLGIQTRKISIIDVYENWGLSHPYAGLTENPEFYGVANGGGTEDKGGVFGPNARVLHNFGSIANDGANPYGGVIVNSGHLYGATNYGGASGPGYGVVYKLNTDGSGYKVLHRFVGSDGAYPASNLIMNGGNLYGTTLAGGKYGYGTIFEMSLTGKILRQYHFGTQSHDGMQPIGSLVIDAGNIFGTASGGGANNGGVIFKLDSSFHLTVLHAFGVFDGTEPQGGLMIDSAGNLYGTTSTAGAHFYGTVFRLIR
jgi:uncharacterized repeat protein (TIGR03803 family)